MNARGKADRPGSERFRARRCRCDRRPVKPSGARSTTRGAWDAATVNQGLRCTIRRRDVDRLLRHQRPQMAGDGGFPVGSTCRANWVPPERRRYLKPLRRVRPGRQCSAKSVGFVWAAVVVRKPNGATDLILQSGWGLVRQSSAKTRRSALIRACSFASAESCAIRRSTASALAGLFAVRIGVHQQQSCSHRCCSSIAQLNFRRWRRVPIATRCRRTQLHPGDLVIVEALHVAQQASRGMTRVVVQLRPAAVLHRPRNQVGFRRRCRSGPWL